SFAQRRGQTDRPRRMVAAAARRLSVSRHPGAETARERRSPPGTHLAQRAAPPARRPHPARWLRCWPSDRTGRALVGTSTLIDELTDRAQRASRSWQPGARVVPVEPLTGGASSLTFTTRFEGVPAADEVVVLKVAPPGLPAVRNRDVLRQGTVMRALAGHAGVLVPEV